jgi:hypothetical protein
LNGHGDGISKQSESYSRILRISRFIIGCAMECLWTIFDWIYHIVI